MNELDARLASEREEHRRARYAPSTYRGILIFSCPSCGREKVRTPEDMDQGRDCRECRAAHVITTRPAVWPDDGTRIPGSLRVSCPCGWWTTVINDPLVAAKRAGDAHLANPTKRPQVWEVLVRS
jgi:hypothetical protein